MAVPHSLNSRHRSRFFLHESIHFCVCTYINIGTRIVLIRKKTRCPVITQHVISLDYLRYIVANTCYTRRCAAIAIHNTTRCTPLTSRTKRLDVNLNRSLIGIPLPL